MSDSQVSAEDAQQPRAPDAGEVSAGAAAEASLRERALASMRAPAVPPTPSPDTSSATAGTAPGGGGGVVGQAPGQHKQFTCHTCGFSSYYNFYGRAESKSATAIFLEPVYMINEGATRWAHVTYGL
jgi:hypothetical protein